MIPLKLLSLLAATSVLVGCGAEPVEVSAHAPDPVEGTPAAQPGPIRAIWVTRFDYVTADDVRTILANCAEAGFDTVMFQVRGNGTAFYDSPKEPWAVELGGTGPGGHPGFDPLALAIEEAAGHGISIHAWVNLMPSWWGTEPPPTEGPLARHLYHTRPEWHWWSESGQRQELCEDFYVSLNPCLPEVRAYLTGLVVDLAQRYDVEGIHLDYARFPNEFPATPRDEAGAPLHDWPRDPRTLALYRADTGLHPDDAPESGGPHPWDAWRAARVTELIGDIRGGLLGLDGDVPVLSAAVTSIPEKGLEHHQDAHAWMAAGLVDAVFPMNYIQHEAAFTGRLEHWPPGGGEPGSPLVVMGVRASEAGDNELTKRLIRRAVDHDGGFCLFAYSDLFDSTNETIDTQDEPTRARRAEARRVLVPFLREL